MDSRQTRTVTAFESILLFFERAEIKPEPPLLREKRKELEASIRRLRELSVRHLSTGTRRVGERARDLSQRLRRERMMPLVRVVKPMMAFAPQAERVLKVPHARADTMTVATTALEMAKLLKPHGDLLESAGFSKTFLSELQEEARRLAVNTRGSEASRQERSRVTREIAEELKSAKKTITVIEGIVMLHFARQPAMQQLWKSRRRVGKRLGRPAKKNARRPERPSDIAS